MGSLRWLGDGTRFGAARNMALAGLVLLMLLGLRSPSVFYLCLLFVLLAFALTADRNWRPLAREPLIWIALLLFVAVFVRGWIDVAMAEARGLPVRPESVWHHARYGLFIPLLIGFWFAAHWRHRYTLLLLLGCGVFVWYGYEWESIAGRWPWPDGAEIGHSFNEGALIAMVMFYLALAVVAAAWTPEVRNSRLRIWLHVGGGSVVGLASLVVVVISHSRSAYLVMLFTLVVLIVAGGWHLCRHGDRQERRLAGMAIGGAALAVVVVFALAGEFILHRLDKYGDLATAFLTGRVWLEGVPEGARGWARVNLIRQGLLDIAERPWVGVGPVSVRDMVDTRFGITGSPGTGNYHNTYINLAVAMGLPWALLWIGAHVWAVWRALRHVLVVERDVVLALAISGMVVAHFGHLMVQVRIWSGFSASAIYLLVMIPVCAALWRSHMHRRRQQDVARHGVDPSEDMVNSDLSTAHGSTP